MGETGAWRSRGCGCGRRGVVRRPCRGRRRPLRAPGAGRAGGCLVLAAGVS
ncbi:MAG: hypothetical protein MZV63_40220 [Marinilabiliales bacterium]|nr:hypothetical protein [Marinilabiliales bacterium]